MENKSKKIQSEISAGELLDKISILEIKIQKITDKNNLNEVKKEYEILKHTQKNHVESSDKIEDLFNSIKEVNLTLWNIEDETLNIRLKIGQGVNEAMAWGCDLSDKYIRINADYTT